MKTLDRILGWTMLVFGLLHTVAGVLSMSRHLNIDTTWFFSGGLAIIFCAFLNLLRVPRDDGGVARASVLANLMLLVLSVLLCWILRHDLKANPQAAVFLPLVAIELVLSLRQWLR